MKRRGNLADEHRRRTADRRDEKTKEKEAQRVMLSKLATLEPHRLRGAVGNERTGGVPRSLVQEGGRDSHV